ncbi:YadA-like family protein, partial [Mannheimia sp. HC-2023]|uniref:YadA family autotransporter adhesin n=1 Tax=Mannheimia indoligenes TaxID=3103145 RepID=UPI002FE56B24
PTNPDGTPNGDPEQVATLNDGLIFTGNNELLNRHKLNTVVKIVGDGVNKAASDSFKSAVGNINVVADKNDTLTIQLNKDLKDIDSITVNNGPTINGDGINMNGDTITNLGDGKEDGDAVNVKQMKASRTTVTSSDNSISVVDTNNGKGDNFAYDIKVNNQAVVENAQIPVVYTNKDGDKVYKQPDGTFNTKPDGTGNNVKPADVIASMNSGDNSTNNPTTLANVKSNLAPVTPADKSQPAANNPADLADKLNNAATVGDVLNAGWNLQGNGKAVDTVVHNDTVNFVNGVGTTARVETTDGKISTVTYDVNVDNKTITTEEVADPNNPGNKITQIKANTTELKDENKDGKVDAPSNEDGDKLVNAKNVADAINSSGFNLKTSATDGEKLSGDDELINPGDSVEMVAGKNLTVKQEANGKVTYATKDDVQFNSVTSNKVIVGDATDPAKSSTLTSGDNGLDVGGDKITNVADGDISPVSTDVINGKQLNNYTKVNGNNIGTDQDGSINIVNGNGTTVTSDKAGEIKVNVNNTDLTVAEEGTINVQDPNGTGAHYVNANTVAKAVNEVSWSVNSETDKATANAATQNTYKPVDNKVKAGSQVKVNAGRNVEISGSGRNINVAVSDNPEFNSVKVGGTKLSSKVAEDGVNELNIGGNNNAPTRITNVAAGVKNTDAVNVSQLKGAVNNLDNKINRNNRDLRAGIAGANAAAGLPQVYIPGKSMVAAAAGTFKGENALAVGYSRSSDNGKVILKLQGNANTRGDLGGSVGVGYQW